MAQTYRRLAEEVARTLNDNRRSPFHQMVRLDPKGHAPLPLAALCSEGASDLGTSLVGLARIGMSAQEPKSAQWLADAVVVTVNTLKTNAPDLVDLGKMLTPPPNGTKDTAGLLVAIGVALAFRMLVTGRERPTPIDLDRLVVAAQATLDGDVATSRKAPTRRKLAGAFVRELFADLPGLKKLDGIPERLLTLLHSSAYGPPGGCATQPQGGLSLKERKREARDLLRKPEVSGLTDREIGRRCGLDGKTVAKLKREVCGADVPQIRQATRKGQSYFIDVSQIGKKS